MSVPMKDKAFQDAFDKVLLETEKMLPRFSSDTAKALVRCPVCHWRLSVDCCTAGRALIALRERVWSQLAETRPKPPMMTACRIEKAKWALWTDENFWWDMLDRHGLRHEDLDELEPEVREHAIGNFWGQLCRAWSCMQNSVIGGKDDTSNGY